MYTNHRSKGLVDTITSVGVAILVTFVVVYIISFIADFVAIDSTSPFYGVYKGLTNKTYTVFNAVIMAIIIATLAIIICYIRSVNVVDINKVTGRW